MGVQFLKHPEQWCYFFSYLAPQKVTLFILPTHFTKHPAARNGNGSGSGRVFPYPDPTRRARPVTWTRPVQGTGFFFRGPNPPQPGPAGPVQNWAQFVAQSKKKKKLSPNLFLPTLSLHFWAQSKKKKKKFKPKFIFAYIKPAYSNAIQA